MIDDARKFLHAARHYFISPPESPGNWGLINRNVNDYLSDPMEITCTFRFRTITDRLQQHKETHPKYPDRSDVAHDIFSIIPHGVGVEASFRLGRDFFGWRQPSITTGKTLPEKYVVRQNASANDGILAGDDPVLDRSETDNDLALTRVAEERKLHRMAKVHDFLKMWQGSQNLRTTQKESRAPNKQMTAVGYISDTEAIVKAS